MLQQQLQQQQQQQHKMHFYELRASIGWSIEWPKLGEPRNFLPI
jgi:hypothetical protein